MNDPIRVGVIGAGAISQVAHLPVLRRLPGVEVAAICDNDVGKAQALATRFDVKDTYDDIEEVLRYARADVAVVCTPNHLHEMHVLAALSAGLHVLCEPPLALTVAGVERVLKASERYGKRVMAGMNHRFRSDVQAVRGFMSGGELGTTFDVPGLTPRAPDGTPSSRHISSPGGGCAARRQEAGRSSTSVSRCSISVSGCRGGPSPSESRRTWCARIPKGSRSWGRSWSCANPDYSWQWM